MELTNYTFEELITKYDIIYDEDKDKYKEIFVSTMNGKLMVQP